MGDFGSSRSGDPQPRAERLALAVVTGAIVLVPFATITLPYRRALYTQALTLLALTAGLLAAGLVRPGWGRRIGAGRCRVAAGVGLYGLAALHGGAVGLARGNEVELLAGQVLSMALLPLAALAGAGLGGGARSRPLAWGLGAGVASASLLHWLAWLASPPGAGLDRRLFFANAVSVVGASLLGLLLLATLVVSARGILRVLAGIATLPVLLLILASGVRGLWVATVLAVAVFLVLAFPPVRRQLALLGWMLAVAGAAVGVVAMARWVERPRPNLLPAAEPSALLAPVWGVVREVARERPESAAVRFAAAGGHCHWALAPAFPVPELKTGTYRLRGRLTGPDSWRVYVALQWFDGEGRLLGRTVARRVEGSLAEVVTLLPRGAVSARVVVGCPGEGEGEWLLHALALHRLGPAWLLRLPGLAQTLESRLSAGLLEKDRVVGAALRVRLRESRRLWDLFRHAAWGRKLSGHGLGATYAFDGPGRDERGRLTADAQPNYIHNFYLFLLYKLGLLGTGLVVVALVLWLTAAVAATRRLPYGLSRAFAAAAAAGLAAYSLWSLSSPEILDFRVAPLWGLLLAALARLETVSDDSGEGGAERLDHPVDLALAEAVMERQRDGTSRHRLGDRQGSVKISQALADVGLEVNRGEVGAGRNAPCL